jgi:hypothetical protein
MGSVLDWSGQNGAPRADMGPLKPCKYCGRPALLRHPTSGEPCHKVCAEAEIDRRAS